MNGVREGIFHGGTEERHVADTEKEDHETRNPATVFEDMFVIEFLTRAGLYNGIAGEVQECTP